VELHRRIAAGEVGTPVLAHCVHRNVDVPESWTSETTVVSAASHEIDVMPWIFGQDIIRVTWLSPRQTPLASLRDPQVVIMELEGGALVFDEIFMRSGYGYEIRCEVVGTAGTIELAPTARVVTRSRWKVSRDFPPDWRGRFADAYRRELQTWVDAVIRWRAGDVESTAGPVDGPDAWDGYRAALVAQTVLLSMAQGTPVPSRADGKSTHKSDLAQPHSGRLLQTKNPLTFPYRRCQWFFAEDRLSDGNTCGDILSVRRVARGDNHGINLGRLDEEFSRWESLRAGDA
jgi:predicted dehydrogenase